jgi:maleate isomerase
LRETESPVSMAEENTMQFTLNASMPALGIVVPPANPTIEPELARLISQEARLFAARLPVMPGTTLEQRNAAYVSHYEAAVGSFGSLSIAAMVIGLTGPSYRLGPVGDDELAVRLSTIAGTSVQTASGAIRAALLAIGAKRLCLFSPYPDWLTAHAVAYWTDAGFSVIQVVKVSEIFRAYELTSEEVRAALDGVDQTKIDAVVMSGTGMLTLPVLVGARAIGTKPLLSSNLCCSWWLSRQGGVPPSELFKTVAPELVAAA